MQDTWALEQVELYDLRKKVIALNDECQHYREIAEKLDRKQATIF